MGGKEGGGLRFTESGRKGLLLTTQTAAKGSSSARCRTIIKHGLIGVVPYCFLSCCLT